jgi:hypothetical protein
MALLNVGYFHSLHSLVSMIEASREERHCTALRRVKIMPRAIFRDGANVWKIVSDQTDATGCRAGWGLVGVSGRG